MLKRAKAKRVTMITMTTRKRRNLAVGCIAISMLAESMSFSTPKVTRMTDLFLQTLCRRRCCRGREYLPVTQ